jgi:hypothetical protein
MRMYSLFIAPLIGSPVTAWFGTYIVGIPANLSSVSNAPILYFTRYFVYKELLGEKRTIIDTTDVKLQKMTFCPIDLSYVHIFNFPKNTKNSARNTGMHFAVNSTTQLENI